MEELGVVGTGDGVGLEGSIGVTNVTACTLAESPSDPFHRKLRQLRCLRCRFDCYRVERTQFPGGTFTRSRPAPFHGARALAIYRRLRAGSSSRVADETDSTEKDCR